MTLTESQLALAALASLCAGERDAIEILRRLVQHLRPTLLPQRYERSSLTAPGHVNVRCRVRRAARAEVFNPLPHGRRP